MFKDFSGSVVEEIILLGRSQGRNNNTNALNKQMNPAVTASADNRKIVNGAVTAVALTFEVGDVLEFTLTINHNNTSHTNNTVFRVRLNVIDDNDSPTIGKQLFAADSDAGYPN